ncbi:MAG TPA: alpha/beta fold hydrolase [Candidatus Baltobacteraceae bacterium]|nr:alpha/beta fold hydrolase [Candidatus Baltobacteraceae bacterium]
MTPAYTEYGDRRNPTILFLHGIRLGRDIWAQHARMLVDRYHVIALDLPGHGSLHRIPFAEATVGALLNDTIARTCAEPPLIVGYSLGGYCAMEYAARRPEQTRALLLSGCTLDFEGWRHWPYEVSARLGELIPLPWYDFITHYTLQLLLPKAWASLVEQIPFDRSVFTRTNATIARHVRFSSRIARYRKPVLFVNGEYDVVFRSDERRFMRVLPQARLRIIPGVDHTVPMRRVQEFAHVVREFADRVFATAP